MCKLMSACRLELDSEEDGIPLEASAELIRQRHIHVDICYSISKFRSTCINAIQWE